MKGLAAAYLMTLPTTILLAAAFDRQKPVATPQLSEEVSLRSSLMSGKYSGCGANSSRDGLNCGNACPGPAMSMSRLFTSSTGICDHVSPGRDGGSMTTL